MGGVETKPENKNHIGCCKSKDLDPAPLANSPEQYEAPQPASVDQNNKKGTPVLLIQNNNKAGIVLNSKRNSKVNSKISNNFETPILPNQDINNTNINLNNKVNSKVNDNDNEDDNEDKVEEYDLGNGFKSSSWSEEFNRIFMS